MTPQESLIRALAVCGEVAKIKQTHTKVSRAMEFCGKVARLYKRNGGPPTWKKLNPEYDQAKEDSPKWIDDPDHGHSQINHQWKRDIRKWAYHHRPVRQVAPVHCPTCGLFFVGASMQWLCRCPVAKPQRAEERC